MTLSEIYGAFAVGLTGVAAWKTGFFLVWQLGYKRLYRKVSFRKQSFDAALQVLIRAGEKVSQKTMEQVKISYSDDSYSIYSIGESADQLERVLSGFNRLSDEDKVKLDAVMKEIRPFESEVKH
ncbi:hypothetical protein L9H26_18925 [Morganella psychrotolerans]|uniref:Uncharacterized protein n=1 Tax=Morganella psychrotolerans TaxID=368603 RepID=A0A5M9QY49_9GAMM|nr:hypothetical protein [Morganella psychrotolerans]KAA8712977.1 hypothetical protein F4V73_17825 [Morganella psychrotolerans]OBU01922.1 hypothetical protein AYY16_17085 [Morganella psychrotolerans]